MMFRSQSLANSSTWVPLFGNRRSGIRNALAAGLVCVPLLGCSGYSGDGDTAAKGPVLEESEVAAIRQSSRSPAEFIAAVKAKRRAKMGEPVLPEPPAKTKSANKRR